jgi:RNA polymerase sigma-70 factor (ECF subfamily)
MILDPEHPDMTVETIMQDVIATTPHLRAFAIFMTGRTEHADELVQSTIHKALTTADQWRPGTNPRIWLFITLCDEYHIMKIKWTNAGFTMESTLARIRDLLETGSPLGFGDMLATLSQLDDDQRKAFLLTVCEEFQLDQVAEICRTTPLAIKDRLVGARMRLTNALSAPQGIPVCQS